MVVIDELLSSIVVIPSVARNLLFCRDRQKADSSPLKPFGMTKGFVFGPDLVPCLYRTVSLVHALPCGMECRIF